jgi:hypothetical protein
MTQQVFWCRGTGLDRVSVMDKPERCADLETRDCPKFKQHVPHTWVARPATPAKGASA